MTPAADGPSTAPPSPLETLAAALNPAEFATSLTTVAGRPSRLTVTSRHAAISDDIYADRQSYWWSWADRIAPIDDPHTAAAKIGSVLRTSAPRPADD